jgi:hypothetical protein
MLATLLPRIDYEELMTQIGSDVGGGMGNEIKAYFYTEFEKLFQTKGRNASFGSSASDEESDEDSDEESAVPSASSDLGEETTGSSETTFSSEASSLSKSATPSKNISPDKAMTPSKALIASPSYLDLEPYFDLSFGKPQALDQDKVAAWAEDEITVALEQ